jgi:putative Mg2+ transporter-C (MgtC) family protein
MTYAEFALDIAVAFALGMAIGVERQWRQRTAGLRTNTLVALGAALFVSISRLADHDTSPTRIASYVVGGLGFLGGGVILREGLSVRGMNTAATLWCSGAVGALSGMGHPLHAVLGAAAVLFVHIALRPVVRFIDARSKYAVQVETYYRVRVSSAEAQEAVVRTILMRHVNGHPGLTLHGLTSQDGDAPGRVQVIANIFSYERNDKAMEEIVARIGIEPGVSAVSWEMGAP